MKKLPGALSDEQVEELLKSPTNDDPVSEFVREYLKDPDSKGTFIQLVHEDLKLFLGALPLIKDQAWFDEALDEAIAFDPSFCFHFSDLIGDDAIQKKLLEKIREQVGTLLD